MKELIEKISQIDELNGIISHNEVMYLDKLTHLEQRLADSKKEIKLANEKYTSLFESALKKKENDSQQNSKYFTETID